MRELVIYVEVDTRLAKKWVSLWTWFAKLPFAVSFVKKFYPLIVSVTKRLIRVNVLR